MKYISWNEYKYLKLLRRIHSTGVDRGDRTGTGTRALFGVTTTYDCRGGHIPLLVSKRVHTHSVFAELRWMITGDTNAKTLQEKGVTIWDEWAAQNGSLGRIYGAQWRDWEGPHGKVDQLRVLLEGLRNNPEGRRHVVTAWNPGELEDMALPPCHCFFQCFVYDGKLSLSMYQRSADMFLGVPFNIAGYSTLLILIARALGLEPDKFTHHIGDAHIYSNHREQVQAQLDRVRITAQAKSPYGPPTLDGPMGSAHAGPHVDPQLVVTFEGDPVESLLAGTFEVAVTGYDPLPAIPAPVAV